MGKLEKDVSKEVKIALDALEASGACLWWERLNSGKIRTEYGSWLQLCRNGTADFIAVLPVKNGVIVYFMETKSDNGRQTPQQKEFEAKVTSWGAIYDVVKDVKQVRTTVEQITGFYKNKLDGIEF